MAKRTVPFSGTTSIRYQHTDALGSPVAETNEAGALAQPRERLTAYGEPADGTWQAGPGFTGHQMDASSRLVYMQQRYYDPVSGRFLSVDLVKTDSANGRNFNRYWYANDNPHAYVDPDGRYSCKGNRAECAAIKKKIADIRRAARRYGQGSSNRRALNRIANFYGTEDDGNKVEVRVVTSTQAFAGEASTVGGATTITINAVAHQELGVSTGRSDLGATLVHEGNHGFDQARYGMPKWKSRSSEFWHEMRATAAEALYFKSEAIDAPSGIWTKSGGFDAPAIQDQAERSTEAWCDAQGGCR
ncbi:RHS repeat-associated core domain-containing protein [Arenimonas terrae]|uniref:RHS repeat-associated core domain-containing protein n=1 Tax=Arenimonas terrae TaxID=2546226 RepID=UPI00159EDBD5|nr:RHS repeat-associated core domain-containing protein [Arenimonas terrae]